MPDGRLSENVWTLPGVPRQVGLRLPLDESPIDHPDIHSLADRQYTVNGRSGAPRHVLGADGRPALGLELSHPPQEGLRPLVIVEAQDIRLGDLGLFDGVQARGPAPVRTVPEGAGERLSRMLAARPGENLR